MHDPAPPDFRSISPPAEGPARPVASMTGAGFATGDTELGPLRVEVRTTNGRALSIKVRLPSSCGGLEAAVEEVVRRHLVRGSAAVVVERCGAGAAGPDPGVLRSVATELGRLAAELGLPPPTVADVLAAAAPRAEPVTSKPLPPRFAALLAAALDQLVAMRRVEGATTAAAIGRQLEEFERQLAAAAARAPALADAYREQLLRRVQEFATAHLGGSLAAVDLVREVALYAERVDAAEELQRLVAHLDELRATLRAGGEPGRRIEFLLQELLRETNTLGAKSPDVAIAHAVVAMKTSIDRMREQAANLE